MGWHATARALTDRRGSDLETALLLLDHAFVGFLHRPASEIPAGVSAMTDVQLAVFHLEDSGVRGRVPQDIDDEDVLISDVRPLIEAASTLMTHAPIRTADPEHLAHAAFYARNALRALDHA